MTWSVFERFGSHEGSMTRVWKNFTSEEKLLLKNSLQKCCQQADIGPLIIIGLLNDKYESFKILLGKVKEDVKITGPEVLRKEYPRAARIGDVVAKFFEEIIMGIYNDTMTAGEVIKKCRLIGAQHKRMRVQFDADHWLSVKRVIVETIMNYNENTSKSSRLLKKITRGDSRTKLRTVWQNLTEIIVKNMKSGFLDSASYGAEFVENESIVSVEYPSSESIPYVLSTDVFL